MGRGLVVVEEVQEGVFVAGKCQYALQDRVRAIDAYLARMLAARVR